MYEVLSTPDGGTLSPQTHECRGHGRRWGREGAPTYRMQRPLQFGHGVVADASCTDAS